MRAAALLLLLAAPAAAGPHPFTLPAETRRLLAADIDGDGLTDLVAALDGALRVYFQTPAGFDFERGFSTVDFGGSSVGWDLAAGHAAGGGVSVLALVDGAEVLAWHGTEGTVAGPERLLAGLAGFVGRGAHRLRLSQDVDRDGRPDLVIPGAGTLSLHLRDGAGGWRPPLRLDSAARVRTRLDNGRLGGRSGQSVRVPGLTLRDVNADGLDDLVSRTEDSLAVFLADGSAARRFPAAPSYALDLAAIRGRLGEFDLDALDFSNLTGALALTHEEILEDVDGDGIDDLVLREGGKVSLFAGGARGMALDSPRQVLRAGGNVLRAFLRDEDGDGRKDLWLWRVEPVSVGDVFIWLVLSGSIGVEAFIYPNEGGRFARRPARRLRVELKFPSAVRLAGLWEELREEAENADPLGAAPVGRANLDGDPTAADLLVLLDRRLEVFFNRAEPEPEGDGFLAGLGYSRGRDEYEIDIRRVIEEASAGGEPALRRARGLEPDLVIDIDGELGEGAVIPARLNGDALDDVFVFTGHDRTGVRGVLLLSGPAD